MSSHLLEDTMENDNCLSVEPIILDGGLATLLENNGHKLTSDLWSAQLLISDPKAIENAHLAFLHAGANIIISSTYQLSGYGIQNMMNSSDPNELDTLAKIEPSLSPSRLALKLTHTSICIAQKARESLYNSKSKMNAPNDMHSIDPIFIAGSIGPYGACLCDGSEYSGSYTSVMSPSEISCFVDMIRNDPASYRSYIESLFDNKIEPDTYLQNFDTVLKTEPSSLSLQSLMSFHYPRMQALVDSNVDILAFETIPCLRDVVALCNLLTFHFPHQVAYVSVSCKDAQHLASGEKLIDLVRLSEAIAGDQLVAIGVNCVDPKIVESAIDTIQAVDTDHVKPKQHRSIAMHDFHLLNEDMATCKGCATTTNANMTSQRGPTEKEDSDRCTPQSLHNNRMSATTDVIHPTHNREGMNPLEIPTPCKDRQSMLHALTELLRQRRQNSSFEAKTLEDITNKDTQSDVAQFSQENGFISMAGAGLAGSCQPSDTIFNTRSDDFANGKQSPTQPKIHTTTNPRIIGSSDLAGGNLLKLMGLENTFRRIVIVYPNSGELWNTDTETWQTICSTRSEQEFGMLAKVWYQKGALMIGGCCRTTPNHIMELRNMLMPT